MATIDLYLDTSDDDSIMNNPYLARAAARPLPMKKRNVVNVFPPDSSDDDEEADAEIATLTGSQPLSLTEDLASLGSPGIAPPPNPAVPIVNKSIDKDEEESSFTLSRKCNTAGKRCPPTNEVSSDHQHQEQHQTKPSQKSQPSPADLVELDFGVNESLKKNDQASGRRKTNKTKAVTAPAASEVVVAPSRLLEEANQKVTSKKSGKAKSKSSKQSLEESKADIEREQPKKPSVKSTTEQVMPKDIELPDYHVHADPVASTTAHALVDPQQQLSIQRSDSVTLDAAKIALNSKSPKKKRKQTQEKEADKKTKKSAPSGDRKDSSILYINKLN
jgi:hypothetical protein